MNQEESDHLDYEDLGPGSKVELGSAFISKSDIIQLLKTSCEFFLEFFLGEELSKAVPQLHIQVWDRLIDLDLERVLLAIPRDHAKTTLSKLAIVWYFLFTDFRFAVYLSNTNGIALNACKDIVNFMKTPNFEEVFGKIRMEKESETASLWIFWITMPNGKQKRCILRAVGANQQMRGINIDNQRPEIAVVDDVEDNDNTDSPAMQKKLDRWIFGPFLKALSRNRRKVLWLGNMLQKTSLLARLSQNPRWNPVVFGALVKDPESGALVPLWPERWSLEELMQDFQEYVALGLIETWMCEMMNMPGHGMDGFTQESIWYQPVPNPDQCVAAFLVLDPAFGENAMNDNSSVTVHVIREDGLPMVAEDATGKMTEDEIFETMISLAFKWGAWVWGIEAIAAQRVLIALFGIMLAQRSMSNLVQMVPLISGRGDPKVSRITSFVSLMSPKKRSYAIYEGAFTITNQILGYNRTKKDNDDDAIDSCAYGPKMLENHLPLIMAMAGGQDITAPGKARIGMEALNV